MKKSKLIGNVSIFGCGKLGKEMIYNLAVKNIGLHSNSFTTSDIEFDDEYGTQFVDTIRVSSLSKKSELDRVKKMVTCMIVTLNDEELKEHLDLLLSLDVPLIFCNSDIVSYSALDSAYDVLFLDKYISNDEKVEQIIKFLNKYLGK